MGLWGVGNAGGFNSCQRSLAAWLDWKLLSKRHFWGGTAGKINILSVLVPIHLFFSRCLGTCSNMSSLQPWSEDADGKVMNSLHQSPCSSGSQVPLSVSQPNLQWHGWIFLVVDCQGLWKPWNSRAYFELKSIEIFCLFFFFYNLEQKFNFLDMEVRTEYL